MISIAASTQAPAAVQAAPAFADQVSQAVRKAVKVEGIREHQRVLQRIANGNGGTRASGTPGFKASVDYVKLRLNWAGYDVSVLPFNFAFFSGELALGVAASSPNRRPTSTAPTS